MSWKIATILLMSILLYSPLFAQSTNQKVDIKVETTYAEYLGEIPPLRSLIPLPPTDPERRRQAKISKQAPKNFIGRGKMEVLYPERANHGPDPIRQSEVSANAIPVEPLVNVEGLFSPFGSPHDPSGDIGQDHYLQAINTTTLGVFSKTGDLINSFAANTLWSPIGFSSAGDPIIMYDQEVKRWIITEFPNGNQLLFALSQTADPMGAYDVWNFATPNFPDYPKYGIWNNTYHATTNEQGPGSLHSYFIDRQSMLNGDMMVPIQRITIPGYTNTTAGFFVSTPVDWTGLTPPNADPIVLALHDSSWGGVAQDAIEVYSVNVDFDNPNNTEVVNTTVTVSPYDAYACAAPGFGFACVPQQGGGGLDGIPEVIMNQPHYRNFGSHESLLMSFMTDVDGNELAGIRWVELRRLPGGDWMLYQEGTYAPNDGLHRYMSSICMDGQGNIGLGYNVSSPNDFVGVRFTGRRASDPLGEMTVEEYLVVDGENAISSGGRFGDYAHMSVDPTNDRTFWFTTEYAAQGNVRTRILAFELRKDTIDLSPIALLSPISAPDLTANETVQIEIKNVGIETQNIFKVGYIFENGNPVIEDVNFSLIADSVYTHTFAQTVDMSAVGNYSFQFFTVLPTDQATLNDTLTTVVSNIPRLDAGITSLEGAGELNCGDSLAVNFALTNFGSTTLTNVDIIVSINGNQEGIINWTGSLAMGETTAVPYTLTNLIDGENDIQALTSAPNGQVDEVPTNDGFSRPLQILTEGVDIFFNLITDDYPEEISWELTDEGGTVLFNGGPYPSAGTYIENFCLDPEACYSLTMFDSYGDGICCNYGLGSYNITDAEGNILASSTGEFSTEETTNFCATFSCMLAIEVEASAASGPNIADGAIMITATNESGTAQFSIDGGATFQSSNLFFDLLPGDYDVVVMDDADCTETQTVTIDFAVSLVDINEELRISLSPNPTDGVFQINVAGIDIGSTFMKLEVYNAQGQLVFHNRLTKYNNTYTGEMSLYKFPDGVYFVRFNTPMIQRMLRVVKQ
ncbi:MAG: T9SS type A sorting domain-containing protein [Bacteroidota bacterium]